MTKRQYTSGMPWCFWRWSTNGATDTVRRLHIVKTPFGAICLHFIDKPDAERWLHDHPVSFLSVILRGAYYEERWGWSGWRRRFNFIRATDAHKIHDVKPGTITLCFMGPVVRKWGFHTPDGWVFWKDYYTAREAA